MNTQTMQAVTCTRYGNPSVLKVQEYSKPTPKENEVLVKIHASAVTAADTMMRKGTPFYVRFFLGLRKPKVPIIGTGFAGEIEAIGEKVTQFRVGDQVFGETAFQFSANAEYVCISENGVIVLKPSNMSFEEAASVCDGAVTSLNFLKEIANIQAGQSLLVNGSSGSLGTAAIQLGKFFWSKSDRGL